MQRVRHGEPVWYYPVKDGPKFAGVVRGEIFALDSGVAVVNLAEMEPAYGEHVGNPEKTTVSAAALTHLEERQLPKRNDCNRHVDCAAADEKAKAKGRGFADHCHDDCCEECFGN